MKIKIIGITDNLILKEFSVINQGFFKNAIIIHDESPADITVDFTNINIHEKSDYLKYYFKFLTGSCGKIQPWGLLNGMRPTKLIHSGKKRGLSDEFLQNEFRNKYLISEEKLDLLLNVANHQLQVISDLYYLEREVSIYIGIPFCPTRCAYCTFAAYATAPNKKWVKPFLSSLLEEIKIVGDFLKANNVKVTTLYLGGGTATSLEVLQLEDVLNAITTHICLFDDLREITVEAGRPDTISDEKLRLLKRFNVHRISINPQTFHQSTLDTIGRHHTVDDIIKKFYMAKNVGVKNVNMDLIVGLPNEDESALAHSLAQINNLQPESLTVHMLSFKRNSEMSNERGLYTVASIEVLRKMANLTYDFAKNNDYIPYYLYRQKNIAGNLENIGYAKRGHECLYNILMMEEAQNILGLGVGASSKFLIGESVHNPKDLKTYIENHELYAHKKIEMLKLALDINAQSFTYNNPS